MTRARLPIAFSCSAAVALAAFACSSSSTSTPPAADAGIDDAAADVHDSSFITNDTSPPPAVDAGSHCDQLRAQLSALAGPARACVPNSNTPQCTATTQGVCCAITISTQSVQAVNDYDQAVATFKNEGCTIDCTKVACAFAPSKVCEGTGDKGSCD